MAQLRPLTGEQRIRQIALKVRLRAARDMRDFQAGRVDWLTGWSSFEQEALAAEFDRLSAAAGLTPATETPGELA